MVATDYRDAMESHYCDTAQARLDAFRDAVFLPRKEALPAHEVWEYARQLDDIACCVKATSPALSGRQLLIDISAIVAHDLKSGIQRVVRNIIRELLSRRDLGFRVEPVYFDFETGHFRYARDFIARFLDITPLHLPDDVVEAHPGDIYLGLDLFFIVADREPSRRWLQHWRGRGVKIVFVLYDLLPIQLQDCFPPDQIPLFRGWLTTISRLADGITCISRSVADEYAQWLQANERDCANVPRIGYFHLGAELESNEVEAVLDPGEETLLQSLEQQPFILMVGTVEPRKGHEQVLGAFERLWRGDTALSLVIVGTTGWIGEDFVARLADSNRTHAQLHWLEFVSDGLLQALYKRTAGTIMASRGEGFGLPLIEAAYFGSSLLARDLPVLREICGDNAWYFSSTDEEGLAAELEQWLALYDSGEQPAPAGLSWLNWKESAAQLMDCVIRDDWYR